MGVYGGGAWITGWLRERGLANERLWGGADAKLISWGGAYALEEMSARAVSGSGWHGKRTSSTLGSGQGRRPLRGYSGSVSSLLLHGSFLGPFLASGQKPFHVSPMGTPVRSPPYQCRGKDRGWCPPTAKSVGRRGCETA